MIENDVSINDMIQLLRFGGEGISVMLKVAKGTGKLSSKALKGAVKGGKAAALAKTQAKVKLYYHSRSSVPEYNLLSLKTMHKITGGDYRVMTLPTENKEELQKFFKTLKKHKIQAALLPDLNIGDGQTQIAINPIQIDKLKSIIDVYDFDMGKITKSETVERKASEMDFETYWNTGNEQIKNEITEDAIKNIESQTQKKNPNITDKLKSDVTKSSTEKVVRMDKFFNKLNDSNYYPIIFPKAAIVAETPEAYTVTVPNSYDADKGCLYMAVKKENTIDTNNGKDILTHIKKDGNTYLSNGDKQKRNIIQVANKDLYQEHFDVGVKKDVSSAKKQKTKKPITVNTKVKK